MGLAQRHRTRRIGLSAAVLAACAGLLGFTAARANAATAPPVHRSAAPVVGIQAGPGGHGYWQVASDGGVFAFGDAKFYGSMGGKSLNKPMVGLTSTPSGRGYWEVAADGGIFAYGDAGFYGSMGGKPLNKPVVGMAATPSGRGYWQVAADGGIFAYGDAGFYGSMGGKAMNGQAVGLAPTPSGRGYWIAASDGGIFAYGDAKFYGSMGGQPLNNPVAGIAAARDGKGYWLTASDGGVFAYGSAVFRGSMAGRKLGGAVNAITRTPDGGGYLMSGVDGGVFAYGNAGYYGNTSYTPPTPPAGSIGQKAANLAVGWRGYDYHGVNNDMWHASYSPQYWCSDFATYVWQHAGRSVPTYPAVASFWKWAQNNGRATTDLSHPHVGDALFYGSSHVAIVIVVNANGTILTADGDTGGKRGSEATFAGTAHVLVHGPFDPRTRKGPIGTITGLATIA
ncbi:CHAP domain-containing protein [Actinoplanes sp. NPDC051513]|uniref:CHAP domain-containing protein n=1 Tax=Actinoplanes sp. NPDC051513 TaxID=3363908 RepID=UPI0037923D3E